MQGQFGGYGADDLWVNATGFPASTNTQTQSNLSPAITQNNNAYYVQVITFLVLITILINCELYLNF